MVNVKEHSILFNVVEHCARAEEIVESIKEKYLRDQTSTHISRVVIR